MYGTYMVLYTVPIKDKVFRMYKNFDFKNQESSSSKHNFKNDENALLKKNCIFVFLSFI